MNPSKAKGTAWESRVVGYLQACGWTGAERRVLYGSKDRGDVLGLPGIVIETKNEKVATLGAYLDEVEAERLNAGAEVGVAWIHRRSRSSPAAGYVLMNGHTFTHLLRLAGW